MAIIVRYFALIETYHLSYIKYENFYNHFMTVWLYNCMSALLLKEKQYSFKIINLNLYGRCNLCMIVHS